MIESTENNGTDDDDREGSGGTKPKGSHGFDAMLQPYFDLWSNYCEQTNEKTRQLLDDVAESADPRVWQRHFSEAVRQSADAYMRTPAFLNGMKQHMNATVKTKQQADELRREWMRKVNIPTTEDIHEVLQRLRMIEQALITKVGDIETRLSSIEGRLQDPNQSS